MADAGDQLRVFISYARADGQRVADELVTSLEVADFDAFLDRHDIAAGEDWERRLEGLIEASDTVIFVITPRSVSSDRCRWEVEKALALSKRIIPIVAEPTDTDAIPAELSRLNFVRFDQGRSFSLALKELVTALRLDSSWIREHTRLGELAARWERNGLSADLLLRGQEVEAARKWLAATPNTRSVPPTELHRRYIDESEGSRLKETEAELERANLLLAEQAAKAAAQRALSRRTTIGLVASGALTAAAAGLAYWGVNAESRFREAQRRAETAADEAKEKAIAEEASRTDLVGQLTAYSSTPGSPVYDGTGTVSPFTEAILEQLADPDSSLFEAIIDAQDKVLALTNDVQRPFVTTDLNGEIFLRRPSSTRALRALLVYTDEHGDDYKIVTPKNDIAAWKDLLENNGFVVNTLANPSLAEFRAALDATIDVATAKELPALMVPARIEILPRPNDPSAPDEDRESSEEPSSPDDPLQELEEYDNEVTGDHRRDTLMLFAYSGFGAGTTTDEHLVLRDTITNANVTELEFRQSSVTVREVSQFLKNHFAASALILDVPFDKPAFKDPTPS